MTPVSHGKPRVRVSVTPAKNPLTLQCGRGDSMKWIVAVFVISYATSAFADRASYEQELARRKALRSYRAATKRPVKMTKSARLRLDAIAKQAKFDPQMRRISAHCLQSSHGRQAATCPRGRDRLSPSLGPKPEFTTPERVAVKGGRSHAGVVRIVVDYFFAGTPHDRS